MISVFCVKLTRNEKRKGSEFANWVRRHYQTVEHCIHNFLILHEDQEPPLGFHQLDENLCKKNHLVVYVSDSFRQSAEKLNKGHQSISSASQEPSLFTGIDWLLNDKKPILA